MDLMICYNCGQQRPLEKGLCYKCAGIQKDPVIPPKPYTLLGRVKSLLSQIIVNIKGWI